MKISFFFLLLVYIHFFVWRKKFINLHHWGPQVNGLDAWLTKTKASIEHHNPDIVDPSKTIIDQYKEKTTVICLIKYLNGFSGTKEGLL